MKNQISAHTAVYLLVLGLTLGCEKGSKNEGLAPVTPETHEEGTGTETTPEQTVTPPAGSGAVDGPSVAGAPPGAAKVATTLQVALVFQESEAGHQVTYADVASFFENHCVSCHAAGRTLPDLSAFPFAGAEGVTAAATAQRVMDRLTDSEQPMPPAGLLPATATAQVRRWAEQGFLPPPDLERIESTDYKAFIRWEGASAGNNRDWQEIKVASDGLIDLSLGNLPQGAGVSFSIRIVDTNGAILGEAKWTDETVPASGQIRLVLRALTPDLQAPIAGAAGNIRIESFDGNTIRLAWDPGQDNRTAGSDLTYQLVRSSEPVESLADVQALGTLIGVPAKNLLSIETDIPSPAAVWFFNVIITDASGNQALYQSRRAEYVDDQAPGVFNPSLSFTAVTAETLTVSWKVADDNVTPAADLQYRVVVATDGSQLDSAESLKSATEVAGFRAGMLSVKVKGLIPKTKYRFNVEVRDSAGNRALYEAKDVDSANDDGTPYTIQDYGRDCAERMGTIKTFSCLDLEEIPIEVNGVVPNGYPAFGPGGSGSMECDKPALLSLGGSGQCVPHSRLGRLKSYRKDGSVNEDVETVVICRRYNGRDGVSTHQGEQFTAKDFPLFEDVAIIQHHKKTGDTCWYQMLDTTGRDARRVPPPTEDQLPADAPASAIAAKDFWLTPEATADIKCIRCHDSDPWVHTPYIDQMKLANGEPMVPSDPYTLYKNVGRRYFTDWVKEGTRSHSISTTTPNSCTSCHRIGSRNTCNIFAPQSVGERSTTDLSAYAQNTFHLSHWMPVPGQGVSNLQEWHDDAGGVKSDFEKLSDCCDNPNAAGCVKSPINTLPLPFLDSFFN